MTSGPLGEMSSHGQGVWLRGLRRGLVHSGRLVELMESAAVSGVATDLTVLAGALSRGAEYSEFLAALPHDADGAAALLLAREAQIVAQVLGPLYDDSDGRDGMVSVCVSPATATDAEAMARAARRLLEDADAPNVMVELPPTDAGYAVFETLVADGLHVAIGPVFAAASVRRATQAFVRGSAGGGTADVGTAMVLFGVAPIDALVDELLQREIRAGGGDMSGVESLIGGAGVAAAKVAWRAQRELLVDLEAASSRRLRLAWVDLSSSDPRQPRERYVQQLVGPDTVALLDGALMSSVTQRGALEASLGQRVDDAQELLAELDELGFDAEQVGAALEAKALRRERAEYAELERCLTMAAGALRDGPAAEARAAGGTPWWAGAAEIGEEPASCRDLEERRAVARMWHKDASLWSDEGDEQDLIRNRLGWLDLAATPAAAAEPLLGFAAELEVAEVEDIVLLGMGGSSLTAAVCRDVFDAQGLRVLDSTVPASVRAVADQVDPARTAVLVASKSGSTVEVRALFDWFYGLAAPIVDHPGERFAAITDPGTPLEQLAHERRFGRLWLAPADVGGRFSALTVFGRLPMVLMGIDVGALLASARRMAAACAPEVAAAANPAARLAAALYDGMVAGRDKVTFLSSPTLSPFARWAEQLVAESTGKQGTGLIPVVDEPAVPAACYGDDRLFVVVRLAGEKDEELDGREAQIAAAGHPVVRLLLDEQHEIGGEFFRWEAAVALLGALMGVNPFDQPDVQGSKERTARLLEIHRQGEPMSDQPPVDNDTGWAVFADLERDTELADRQEGEGLASWLAAHLGRAAAPDYVALQAFLPATGKVRRPLQKIRRILSERRGVATTLGWGPAFLHSTGQLHKGGPGSGIFLQITADETEDIEVPGTGHSFGTLLRAQSLGDLAALQHAGRRVLRVHLRDVVAGCSDLLGAAERAIR